MTVTLADFNAAPADQALRMLDGLYEHSPWIAEAVLGQRPFASVGSLRQALVQVVDAAPLEQQIALIRAHPELAGKAAEPLTAESASEQQRAGLMRCTPEELAHIRALNAAYGQRFGWPFVLAVRGPDGLGLTKHDIMACFERRLTGSAEQERAECLRNIHRIAELRLADKIA